MYEEYSKFPGITKQRMYYETMEKLLPDLVAGNVDSFVEKAGAAWKK